MIHVIEFKQVIRPGREPVDMVLLGPQGAGNDRTRTWHRVDKIRPPETRKDGQPLGDSEKASLSYKDMVAKWTVIGPKYEAWKAGNAIPENGTPLAAWAAISQEQGERLKQLGIVTVEGVAEMNDRTTEMLGWPDARKLPGLAKKYLSGQDVAAKDAEIEEMKERMAAQQALLEELLAAQQQAAPKRGRPRKDAAKDETAEDEAA